MLESSWHLFHFISWLTIHWFSSFVMLSACCLMTLMAMLPVLWINVSGIFLILMIYSNYRLFAIAWLKACAITIRYHLAGLSNSEKCAHRESHRQTLLRQCTSSYCTQWVWLSGKYSSLVMSLWFVIYIYTCTVNNWGILLGTETLVESVCHYI